METKDLLALLAGVDIGLLAAALTLLAVYPAIGALLKAALGQVEAGRLVDNNKLRSAVISSLRWAITSSWVALICVIVLGGFTYVASAPARAAGASKSFGEIAACVERVGILGSLALTVVSLILLGIAALRIFEASEKTG